MKFPVSRFIVHGNSMLPTLRSGQEVLTFNWVRPKIKDIVVAKRGIIKRIQKIQGNKIYLIGDNKKESTDSRSFGPVSISEIVGKVILVVR